MGDINWGPVGQWFSGFVALLALGYILLRDELRERWTRPNLMLNFGISPGYVDQRNTRLPDGSLDQGCSRWVRIQVRNQLGRRFAKNCRAYLVGFRVLRPDGTVAEQFRYDTRQLQWMHGNYQPEARDLLPGIPHQIDLVSALDGLSVLTFRVNPPDGRDIHGRYVFTVHVGGENADPRGIEVTVDWGGTRESLRPVDFRLLTRKEMTYGTGDLPSG
jgi:hypothetical protein